MKNGIFTIKFIVILINFFIFLNVISANELKTGRIVGKLVDFETGEPLIGANIFIKGTNLGASSDLNGNYTILRVPPGNYTIVISIIGYIKTELTDVKISAGQIVKLDVSLKPEAIQMEEVVIEARSLKNTEASLLSQRQRSNAISDAISSENISHSGSVDAAQAMTKVTGTSVVDGKYVYIRGLGDRYSSTQLNGSELPSADPNKKAVQMDIFPSNLLDNIVTIKTFTPDMPGNFTGGMVNIGTKSFPESLTLSLSTSTSYNTQTTFNNKFLSYDGGKTDWLGIDDGKRKIPEPLSDPTTKIPDIGTAYTNSEKAKELDRLSKAFNPVMSPTYKIAPMNQSYSFSIGNQTEFLGRPFGLLGSFSYSRNLSFYDNGISGRWELPGKTSEVNELRNDYTLSDVKSTDEILWGGLINLSYKPFPEHEVGVNYIYNHSGDILSRFKSGKLPRDLSEDAIYETRVLQFIQRNLNSLQFRGEHYLKNLFGTRIEWTISNSASTQDEPDLRFFTDDYSTIKINEKLDTIYNIQKNIYPVPARYYRELEEENIDSKFNISIPFKQWNGLSSNFKFGTSYLHKKRIFRERRFEFRQDAIEYNGDPVDFFSKQGILQNKSTANFFRFGNYVVDATQLSNNYDGDEKIYAFYGMIELPIYRNLRFIGGARFEATNVQVTSQDTSKAKGNLLNNDVLPSISFVYKIIDNMNFRIAFGRTLARPTFRELAPYASFDFVGDFIFIGNEKLKRTLTDNYDIRWEWFVRPGEIYAISGFYKKFTNPIERVIKTVNGEVQYQNVDEAIVTGAEFEIRKQLDEIHSILKYFQIGANFTLIKSKVDIAPSELVIIRALDPSAPKTRQLQGQSPYVLNIDLTYNNTKTSTSASIFYNIFGERLSEVSLGGTPNVFEQPSSIFDFTISQKLWYGLSIKASAKNLLNPAMRKVHHFKGKDYVYHEYKRGRSFSIGISYNLK